MRTLVLLSTVLVFGCGEILHTDEPDEPSSANEVRAPGPLSPANPNESGSPVSVPITTSPSPSAPQSPLTTPDAGVPPATTTPDAGCEILHDNGAGQTYLSCRPLGTHDEASARLACEAFLVRSEGFSCATMTTGTCAGTVYSSGEPPGKPHGTWTFNGPYVGHVVTYVGTTLGCATASYAGPTWD